MYLRTSVGGQWNLSAGNLTFTPAQFHFHQGYGQSNETAEDDGSEHTLEGKHYPLEMHVVHMADNDGGYVASVIGVLFEEAETTEPLSFADLFFYKLFVGEEVNFQTEFADYLDLENRIIYRGSLTTPPYTELLLWNVIPTTVPLQASTLKQFHKVREVKYAKPGGDYEVVKLRIGSSNRST